MEWTCFDVTVEEKVGHVRLNRPDALNTMIPQFWSELPQVIAELSDRGDVRAIVVSSTGKHFSAGMDLSVFTSSGLSLDGEPGRRNATFMLLVKRLQESFTALERARVPVLAAVQGGCIGGAVDMVCAADMRYASADAYFVIQETNIGMTADVGTLQRLPKLIPDGVAREMVYTGRRMSAQRALEVGLVNEVFDDHEALVAGVLEIAAEIATKSPLTLWGAKEALVYARDHSVPDSLHQIALWQTGAFQPADMMESFAAKGEKRAPDYEDLPPAPSGI
ncbi:MAG: crotonase/enoyl-CoA hydratase family protein [Candidatus Nanopelagicales bacterium]|nr:crotonase/enoyl-CoA hydratase family protein [Actinomycetota bacterium]HNO16326.1 crotonase/enoyl-CoA hydratase family protein [Actinomycetota bacterium]HUM87445.1 crotonase/enoyl-CoA hydratase family protein [Actinomycetota bacterium]